MFQVSRTEYVQDTVCEDGHQQQHAGHQGEGHLLHAQGGGEEAAHSCVSEYQEVM